jgi:hypothetical protein
MHPSIARRVTRTPKPAAYAAGAGISYGLNAATEWRSILEEAAKGALILAILERLCMTRNSNWLEARRPLRVCSCAPA